MWKILSCSIIGHGHVVNNMPNQDYFRTVSTKNFNCVVVSDGLGSKKHSDLGSRLVCHATIQTLRFFSKNMESFSGKAVVDMIKARFLDMLKNCNSKDFEATCLFAFSFNDDTIYTGMLGDGMIAAIKNDDSISIQSDNKDDSFANNVLPLHEKTLATQWNLKKINRHDLKALILATDGVSDTWENLDGYVQGFYDYYKNFPSNSAAMDIEQSLVSSRPKGHTDDQTIVMALF